MAQKKKPRYKDLPRYNAIYGYENEFKNQFSQILGVALKDVKKAMFKAIK